MKCKIYCFYNFFILLAKCITATCTVHIIHDLHNFGNLHVPHVSKYYCHFQLNRRGFLKMPYVMSLQL